MGSELDFGVVFGMEECMEFHIDRVCSEFGFGSFPEMSVGDCVPLHPPPLQGSDVSALLTIMFEMGWHRSPQIVCVKGLPGVSDKTPQYVLVRELLQLVPMSCVRFRILPI